MGKHLKTLLVTIAMLSVPICSINAQENTLRKQLFDNEWKFFLGEVRGAEKPTFNDKTWRDIDLPHDWSIENLPGQEPGKIVGPFSKESIGATATGYTVGGTAWYRKTFALSPKQTFSKTIISFDGVYMNSEVWVNGKRVGAHPYGYTPFYFDISNCLNVPGKPNTIAVKVRNEGQNSRWYSGSGIYRHVWLIQSQAVSIVNNGICITTESINNPDARVKISASIDNDTAKEALVKLAIRVVGPDGKVALAAETQPAIIKASNSEIAHIINISQAKLWSVDEPNLYTAEVHVIANGVETDTVSTTFGIRTIQFSAQKGFLLNDKKVLLKGGCMHHDNGFLGSATIDRAEERRVQLMKAYGFNAIRTSHNPPSQQFLDACDRNGLLVLDEAFDMWERPKNPEDYHLYFKDWWKNDLELMIHRDRNHPSVVIWSIGNEINERADSLGYAIRKKLVAEVHKLDPSRPVTEAICAFWDHGGQKWETTIPSFAELDVAGYNYLNNQYEADHSQFPERIMVGTESYPAEAYAFWQQVEKNPYVIGDFVWTGMDHLGETGCGNSKIDKKEGPRVGLRPWPWLTNYCGDIDLCGFKTPQLHYRDVVWNNSKIEMMVHTPIPDGMVETYSYWGWPDEFPNWNWKGNEGKVMDVRVFSKYPLVRLELNGKVIAEQKIDIQTGITANFKVPYEAGVLKAIALNNDIEVASKELRTTGDPAKIKLTADRAQIKASRNDLSYVKVEITDALGNVLPDAAIPVTFSVSGAGEIAGSGNACPTDMESFNNKVCKTFRGQALVIIRPLRTLNTGEAILKAEASGLVSGEIRIMVQ